MDSRAIYFHLLCSFLGIYVAVSQANEGALEAIACFEEMNKENSITHLLLDVRKPKEIERFCKRIRHAINCITEKEHHLTTAQNTDYLKKTGGVYQFYLNLCPPGTDFTQIYIEQGECFELARPEITSCGSELPHDGSPEMKNKESRCCLLKAYKDCVTTAINYKCGTKTAEVASEMIKKYQKSFVHECRTVSVDHCNLAKKHEITRTTHWGQTDPWFYDETDHFPKDYDRKHWKGNEYADGYGPNWYGGPWRKHKSSANRFSPSVLATLLLFYIGVFICWK